MAKVMTRKPVRDGIGTGTKISEAAVFLAIFLSIIGGIYYYFFVYVTSPTYAFKSYMGAVEAGDGKSQYTYIDNYDKKYFFPTEKKYAAMQIVNGYTDRVESVGINSEVPDASNPAYATINATLNVHSDPQGESLTSTGTYHQVQVSVIMHKNSKGHWKVLLSKSNFVALLKLTPNPPVTNF